MSPADTSALQSLLAETRNLPESVREKRKGVSPPGSAQKKKMWQSLSANPANLFCCWCGTPLCGLTATLEHLIPRSTGGRNFLQNIALACASCNHSRHGRHWKQELAHRREMVKRGRFQATKVREKPVF